MASHRKKTEAAIVADPLPVAANPETSPPSPAPAPVPPSELAATQDDASEALRSQLEAIKRGEAMRATQERRNAWLSYTGSEKPSSRNSTCCIVPPWMQDWRTHRRNIFLSWRSN
jgi:hypothetical protein